MRTFGKYYTKKHDMTLESGEARIDQSFNG